MIEQVRNAYLPKATSIFIFVIPILMDPNECLKGIPTSVQSPKILVVDDKKVNINVY